LPRHAALQKITLRQLACEVGKPIDISSGCDEMVASDGSRPTEMAAEPMLANQARTNKREGAMKFKALGLAGLAVAMTAIPASAHHSFAMFDASQQTTVAGTVKVFEWTNPHAWIRMMVTNSDGQVDQWSIEMGGPSGLARQGWVPKTLKPGMDISVIMHPLKDGSHGGQFLAVTLPDGTQLGNPAVEPTNEAPGQGRAP
jgi:hypothetical protein